MQEFIANLTAPMTKDNENEISHIRHQLEAEQPSIRPIESNQQEEGSDEDRGYGSDVTPQHSPSSQVTETPRQSPIMKPDNVQDRMDLCKEDAPQSKMSKRPREDSGLMDQDLHATPASASPKSHKRKRPASAPPKSPSAFENEADPSSLETAEARIHKYENVPTSNYIDGTRGEVSAASATVVPVISIPGDYDDTLANIVESLGIDIVEGEVAVETEK